MRTAGGIFKAGAGCVGCAGLGSFTTGIFAGPTALGSALLGLGQDCTQADKCNPATECWDQEACTAGGGTPSSDVPDPTVPKTCVAPMSVDAYGNCSDCTKVTAADCKPAGRCPGAAACAKLTKDSGGGGGGGGGTTVKGGGGGTTGTVGGASTGGMFDFMFKQYGGMPVWVWGLLTLSVGGAVYYVLGMESRAPQPRVQPVRAYANCGRRW